MDFLGKVYKLERSENFEDFVKSLKLPSDKSEAYIKSKSTQKLEKNGDEFVITTTYDDHVRELKFKSGVEFDEHLGDITAKNVIVVDGNKVSQTQKFQDGNFITYVRDFSANQLVVTITSNFWSGSAKRFYAA